MANEKLVVIRKWKEPEVRVYVTDQEIGIEMDSLSYLTNLVEQVSNVTFTMTKAQLLNKLTESHNNIVASMKQATIHAV